MDDVQISAEDQERIDGMVEDYRRKLTNLYMIAYLKGAIDEAKDTTMKLRKVANG